MIKKLCRLIYDDCSRFIYNKYCTIFFLSKDCIVRKPKHICNRKYIHIGKNGAIDTGVRLDCIKSNDQIPNMNIGKNFYCSFNCTFLCTTNLIIGDDCMFASEIFVSTENHCMDPNVGYRKGELVSKDVIIGNDCWIGEKVIILPGVTIGNKCIIGAGSVVTKNIPDYCIAVGNPARVVKKFDLSSKKWANVEGDKLCL